MHLHHLIMFNNLTHLFLPHTLVLYGVLFVKSMDAAFSNFNIWQSVGYIISFSYSSMLCTSVKLYILITVFGISAVTYVLLECIVYKERNVTLMLPIN